MTRRRTLLPLLLCVVALRLFGRYLSHTTSTLRTFLSLIITYGRNTYWLYSWNVLEAPGFCMFTMAAPSSSMSVCLCWHVCLCWTGLLKTWKQIGFGARSKFSILRQRWGKALILVAKEAFQIPVSSLTGYVKTRIKRAVTLQWCDVHFFLRFLFGKRRTAKQWQLVPLNWIEQLCFSLF